LRPLEASTGNTRWTPRRRTRRRASSRLASGRTSPAWTRVCAPSSRRRCGALFGAFLAAGPRDTRDTRDTPTRGEARLGVRVRRAYTETSTSVRRDWCSRRRVAFSTARVSPRIPTREPPADVFSRRARKSAELRVNVRDERADRRDARVDSVDRRRDRSVSIDEVSSMTGKPFPGRGVVVAAEEWRWVPGLMKSETRKSAGLSSKDESEKNENENVFHSDCFRASRFEARRFGDARDVEITDARFDARVDALAELEAGFREALSALSALSAAAATPSNETSSSSSKKKKKNFFAPRETRAAASKRGDEKRRKTLSALPALSAVRRSRLAFVNARVRVRVDPEDPEDAREEAGGILLKKDPGWTRKECALEARAARLAWERTSAEKKPGDGFAENDETRLEERVDARGLALTYVDAMDPTTPHCDGFADEETAGDRFGVRSAGSSADEGTREEKTSETSDVSREEKEHSPTKKNKNVVALATARSAASRVVAGWRFSGNAAAAAASVAPTRTVTCDGARCFWDPDAHFAILRVREAWAQLAEQRRRNVSGDVPETLNAEREAEVAIFPETLATTRRRTESARPVTGDGAVGGADAREGRRRGRARAPRRPLGPSRAHPAFPERFRKRSSRQSSANSDVRVSTKESNDVTFDERRKKDDLRRRRPCASSTRGSRRTSLPARAFRSPRRPSRRIRGKARARV